MRNPHSESIDLADESLKDWARSLPEEDCEGLVDTRVGKAMRWLPDKGWVEDRRA